MLSIMRIKNFCKAMAQAAGSLKTGFLVLLFLAVASLPAAANHLFGGELFYTYVSGNTYKITMVLYGDCGSSAGGAFQGLPTAQPEVEVYNGATFFQLVA